MMRIARLRRWSAFLMLSVGLLGLLGPAACGSTWLGELLRSNAVLTDQGQIGSGGYQATPTPSSTGARSTDTVAGTRGQSSGPLRLHTDRRRIVDDQGREVVITGVNWFGMETNTFAPHGLWSRNWEEMLDQIVALGFNALRLPYSNQLFDPASKPNGIDFSKNPDLQGLTGLEIMDKIIAGADRRGLMVILDRHRPDANAQSSLWYTDKCSEDRWISDWVMLAKRYRNVDAVIGADLHNEPHGEATWGSGDPRTDWRLAAEKAGNAILDVNPNWLIFVEGIERDKDDYYWWGGNLMGVADYPVQLKIPNRVVYSSHDYGPGVSGQRWFSEPNFPANLPTIWNAHWGYIVQQDIAPVLVGEFGGRSVGDDVEGTWQRSLFGYLKDNRLSYAYWSLNPNSGDTGGVLNDDWQTVNQAKLAVIANYQAPLQRQAIVAGGQPSPDSVPVPTAKPTPTQASASAAATPTKTTTKDVAKPQQAVAVLKVLYRTGRTAERSNELAPEFQIVNSTGLPVRLSDLELRYWFTAEGSGGKAQVLDVDWSSLDTRGVQGEFVAGGDGGKNQCLKVHFSGEGSLPSGGSVELKMRIHQSDWSEYQQTNDYSFSPTDRYVEWAKVGLYLDGKLVWGVEPDNSGR